MVQIIGERVFEAGRIIRMEICGCQGAGFGQIYQVPNPSTPNVNQKNSKTKKIIVYHKFKICFATICQTYTLLSWMDIL